MINGIDHRDITISLGVSEQAAKSDQLIYK